MRATGRNIALFNCTRLGQFEAGNVGQNDGYEDKVQPQVGDIPNGDRNCQGLPSKNSSGISTRAEK
jgi:hypothetical protein